MNRHMAAGHKNAGTDFGLRRRRLLIGMSSGHQEKLGEDFLVHLVCYQIGLSFGHQKTSAA